MLVAFTFCDKMEEFGNPCLLWAWSSLLYCLMSFSRRLLRKAAVRGESEMARG